MKNNEGDMELVIEIVKRGNEWCIYKYGIYQWSGCSKKEALRIAEQLKSEALIEVNHENV